MSKKWVTQYEAGKACADKHFTHYGLSGVCRMCGENLKPAVCSMEVFFGRLSPVAEKRNVQFHRWLDD